MDDPQCIFLSTVQTKSGVPDGFVEILYININIKKYFFGNVSVHPTKNKFQIYCKSGN